MNIVLETVFATMAERVSNPKDVAAQVDRIHQVCETCDMDDLSNAIMKVHVVMRMAPPDSREFQMLAHLREILVNTHVMRMTKEFKNLRKRVHELEKQVRFPMTEKV